TEWRVRGGESKSPRRNHIGINIISKLGNRIGK
ncbi:MAG: hypothetical protein ACI8VE_001848, partial [Natrialbaceae archaeon]